MVFQKRTRAPKPLLGGRRGLSKTASLYLKAEISKTILIYEPQKYFLEKVLRLGRINYRKMFSKNYRSQEAELKELNRVTPRKFSKKSTIFKYHMAFFSLKIVIKRFKHARTLTSILKHPQKRAQSINLGVGPSQFTLRTILQQN